MAAESIYDRLRAAGLIQTTEPPVAYTGVQNMAPSRAAAYAERALAGECDNVRGAVEGTRNDALNRAAWKVGRLVADGHLNGDQALAALADAARSTGLPSGEAQRTIRHALGDGQAKQYRPAAAVQLDDDDLVEEVDGASLRGAAPDAPAAPQEAGDEGVFEENPAPAGPVTDDDIDTLFPVLDWAELWARPVVDDWIIEPILRRSSAVVLYSPPKVGKSLFTLDVAAAIATGREILGQRTEPTRVLYVDFENDPESDIRERLQAMGYEPAQLGNLRYLSFPALAPLDTETGGRQILAVARRHDAQVIIIDTLSRAVEGEENSNDTYLSLYRHTVLGAKKAGVAFLRLDHSGKDVERGMRGASAKESDVDAVWRLSIADAEQDILTLECTHSRKRIDERTLTIRRVDQPRLAHEVDGRPAWDVKLQELIATFERLGLPRKAGRPTVRAALKRAGVKASDKAVGEALKAWRAVEPIWDDVEAVGA